MLSIQIKKGVGIVFRAWYRQKKRFKKHLTNLTAMREGKQARKEFKQKGA